MTVFEKQDLVHRLLLDLSQHLENLPPPEWHGEVLAARRQAIAAGEVEFEDWENVKRELRGES